MGPKFAPVPAKLVGQIVPRKFVELSDLLQANITQSESEPKLVFDSRMILISNPKQSRKKIDDIVTWMEAFSTVAIMLTSYWVIDGHLLYMVCFIDYYYYCYY